MNEIIFIVEDEKLNRNGIERLLYNNLGSDVTIKAFENAQNVIDYLSDNPLIIPDIVITDIKMPGMNGVDLLKKLYEESKLVIGIILSAHPDFTYAQTAMKYGVKRYIIKPIDTEELIIAVNQGLMEAKDIRVNKIRKKILSEVTEDTNRRSSWNEQILRAISFIEEKFTTNISLEQVAEIANLNANYFSSLFKKTTGKTFSEYILDLKIRKSKELLITTDQRIYEIAEAVGYQSARYFTKAFNEYQGVSPMEFKKLHKTENS